MADKKISAMTVLPNPPLAPVYDAVITNTGTSTANFARPQGVIVQPDATGSANGSGIILQGGGADQGAAGGVNIRSGAPGDGGAASAIYITGAPFSSSGTVSPAYGSSIYAYASYVTLTNSAGVVHGGQANFQGGQASYGGTIVADGAQFSMAGGVLNGTTIGQGGSGLLRGGQAIGSSGTAAGGYLLVAGGNGDTLGGNLTLHGGNAGAAGVAGNTLLSPGTGATNGVLLISNIPTSDPHVLDAKFQTSVAGVGYVGVYSKG